MQLSHIDLYLIKCILKNNVNSTSNIHKYSSHHIISNGSLDYQSICMRYYYPRQVFWPETNSWASLHFSSDFINFKLSPMHLSRSIRVPIDCTSCNHIYHPVLRQLILYHLFSFLVTLDSLWMSLDELILCLLRMRLLRGASLGLPRRRTRLMISHYLLDLIHQPITPSWVPVHLMKSAEGFILIYWLRVKRACTWNWGPRLLKCLSHQRPRSPSWCTIRCLGSPFFLLMYLTGERSWNQLSRRYPQYLPFWPRQSHQVSFTLMCSLSLFYMNIFLKMPQ